MNSDGYSARVAGAAVAIGLGAAIATGQPVASASPDSTQQDVDHTDTKDNDPPKSPADRTGRSPLGSLTKSLERGRSTLRQSLGIEPWHKAPQQGAQSPNPNPLSSRGQSTKLDPHQQTITLDIPKPLRKPGNSGQTGDPPASDTPAAPSSLPRLDLTPRVEPDKPFTLTSGREPAVQRPKVPEITSDITGFTPAAYAPGRVEPPAATIAPALSSPPATAPTSLVQRVFGVLGSSSSLIPGQDQPVDNPLGWVVLAWARRQIQKTPLGHVLLNSAPVATTPVTMVGDTVTIDATDPDADNLTYTVTQPEHGVVVQDPTAPNKFTYTGEGNETFTVTVSDADSGFHFHGIAGLFAPDGGHTTTVVVNVPAQEVASTPPTVTEFDIDPGPGYTKTGSPFVGSNNTAVQYATGGTSDNPTYALAIRGSDGSTKVVDLGGKPVDGQNPLITDTAVVQNIQRADGSYAMVVVPTAQTVAPQARAAVNPAAFSTLDVPSDSYAVNLDGAPAGYAVAGQNGIVYQTVDPNASATAGMFCTSCRIAVVDTTRVSEAGYTPDVVDIPGTITPGFATIGGTKYTALSVDGDGNLYVVATNSSQPSKVWIIDPATTDPSAANDGATVITLNGFASPVQPVAFGPDGKGYIGTSQNQFTGPGQVEIIDPATQSVVSVVPLAEGTPGLITFANGNVYQQAFVVDSTDPAHPTIRTVMWVIPQGGGTAHEIVYAGNYQPYGWPVAAADGTVYQGMAEFVFTAGTIHLLTGVIEPNSTTPVVVDLGSYGADYQALYQLGVVTGGTQTYQVVGGIDTTDNTGQTKVFRLSDADPDQTNHPLQPVATIDEHPSKAAAVAAPDGTLYFATQKPTGEYTIWSLAPGSDTPAGTTFTGQGDPTAFEVTPDGHVYLTTKSADGTQSWVYAVDQDNSLSV